MMNAHFLTVADAVRNSAEEFEAAILAGLREGVEQMSNADLQAAFFPELVGADVDMLTMRKAA